MTKQGAGMTKQGAGITKQGAGITKQGAKKREPVGSRFFAGWFSLFCLSHVLFVLIAPTGLEPVIFHVKGGRHNH